MLFSLYLNRVDRIVKPTNLHGLRSRSSSANSGSGCTSPARSPRPRSPSPSPPGGCRDYLSSWSASVPTLNAERHFENGHSHGQENVADRLKSRVGFSKFGKENRLDERPERPEKPERRLNSKELIEKQKNWTSHFSKTRPSRYNSDPNHSLVQTSLNQNSKKFIADPSSPTDYSPDSDYQEIEFAKPTDSMVCPATRSASFCSSRPPPCVSPPPPLPPTRNSSAVASKRERPASITGPDSPVSPEYATVEKSFDSSPSGIPEYAVVQKPPNAKQNAKQESKVVDNAATTVTAASPNSLPEYAIVQKNTCGKIVPKGSETTRNSCPPTNNSDKFEIANSKNAATRNTSPTVQTPLFPSPRDKITECTANIVDANQTRAKRDLDHLETPDYVNYPTSPVRSPPKTSEWRNVWLAKNDELLKSVSESKLPSGFDLESRNEVERTCSRPDWAKPSVDIETFKREIVPIAGSQRPKSPEAELRPPSVGTDSASSSMSSPSSPSKDSKEEKADKEMPEKCQIGEQ